MGWSSNVAAAGLLAWLLALSGACSARDARQKKPGPAGKTPPKKKTEPLMVCRNLTKGNVVASRLAVATTWPARRKGLLGRTSLEAGEGMLLEPCRSVHTVGMKFPIDIVFLDRARRVVALFANVKPGVLNRSCRKARSTLELPAGSIAAKRIEVGDTLEVLPRKKAEEAASGKPDAGR